MADAVKSVYDLLSSEKKKESASIHPKEFFWDQFLKYIASAILALTVLNVSIEFLRGGGVSCFPPSDNVAITAADLEGRMLYEFGRGQTSYINNYCARSVPQTEYFPIYILIHGLLLIVPHYVWNAIHNGDFDSFFSIVEKLDRLRDSKTGEYHSNNFDRVTKLEQEYSSRKIYFTYILKLALQLLICIGSVVFSVLYFQSFSFIFFCPGDSVDDVPCPVEYTEIGTPCGWPLNTTVPCVYTSLRILSLIRYADFILLTVAAGLVLFGLAWCLVRHTEQLGYSELAKFSFQSCLKPESFVFPSIFSWPTYSCYTSKKSDEKTAHRIERFWLLTHYPRLHLRHIVWPRILHDLDFLLLMLYRADSSHGQVFKDIQTNRELKRLVGRDHQLLHLYINIQQDLPTIVPPKNQNEPNNEEDTDSSGCCDCLTRLFKRRSSQRSAGVTNPMNNDGTEQTDNGEQSGDDTQADRATGGDTQADRATEEFHSLFQASGFNGNAEKAVYERFKPHLGTIEFLEENMKGIRDVLFWFVTTFGPHYEPTNANDYNPEIRNDLALDISFGSIGYSLILARPFVQVISVNFQPHYQNTSSEPVVKEEFCTNYITFKFPSGLYSQSTESITGAQMAVYNCLNKFPSGPRNPRARFDFVVIGPITEESKLVSVNLLLNYLYGAGRIGKDAILLSIRPLKIGSKKVGQQFFKYEPSKTLFDHAYASEAYKKVDEKFKHTVDGCPGIRVDCGTTPCIFEMIAYKYFGKIDDPPNVQISTIPLMMPHHPPPDGRSVYVRPRTTEDSLSSTETPLSPDSGVDPSSPMHLEPPQHAAQSSPGGRERSHSEMSLDPDDITSIVQDKNKMTESDPLHSPTPQN